jgi:soluble lytic murein transglycosylase-like protein
VLLIAALSVLLMSSGGGRSERSGGLLVNATDDVSPATHFSLVAASLRSANAGLSDLELARISAAVVRYSAKYELEPDLVTAMIIVESGARPWARSNKGAVGLMQVMPHMMSPMQLAGNMATIESNIEAGCQILSSNIRRLGVDNGISAYFWGSEIRGVAYLEKVLAARERLRGLRTS